MSDAFTCWQDVQSYVTDDPDYVTWFLNDTNAYELMDTWFDLYDLPNSNQQVILFLKSYLKKQAFYYLCNKLLLHTGAL